jgi:TonB family protein
MTKKQERHIIASIGTVLFLLLLALILWYARLYAVVPENEEGIEIAFLEESPDTGGAPSTVPNPSPTPADAPAAPAQPAVSQPRPATPPEPIVSEEETLAIERARKEKEEREAAERARQKKEAEQKEKANAMASLFGKTDASAQTGTGSSQGAGQKGNPVGHGSSGGNSWSLAGRGIKGTLPKPNNTFNQEGKVIVEIRVNAAGMVVSATVKGGNISDKETQQLALDAAKKAKFTEGDHDQIGTITYNFKFK